MRSSRVSRDTAKLFDKVSGATPSRRTTRSSLSQFNYSTNAPIKHEPGTADFKDEPSPPSRKRRRVDASTTVTSIKSEHLEEALTSISSPPSKAQRRDRKPARKTTDPSTGQTTVAAPSDWEEMYQAVREMRAPGGVAHGAAVDTMGCERLADPRASPKDQRFHTLVALMLSSQTKDTVNAVAMARLKTELPAHKPGAPVGLNLDNMLAVDPKALNEMIWAVGFHNNKTKCGFSLYCGYRDIID